MRCQERRLPLPTECRPTLCHVMEENTKIDGVRERASAERAWKRVITELTHARRVKGREVN